MTNNAPILPFQEAQLRKALEALQSVRVERETYLRLLICLVRAFLEKMEVVEVEGNVAVKRADFDAVPSHFTLGVRHTIAKPAEGEEGPDEDVYVLVVGEREAQSVVVPTGPRLIT